MPAVHSRSRHATPPSGALRSRRLGLRWSVVSVIAALGSAAVLAPTASAAPDPAAEAAPAAQAAASPAKINVWAPEFMERKAKISESRAITDAQNYPVIVATKKVYTPYVAKMKAAQPGLVLALYSNGTFARSSELNSLPSSALLKDAKGKLIKHREYDLWLANPNDPGWINSRIALCRSGMAEYNYNGCLLDNLGPAPVNPSYVSAAPINPATKKPWTAAQWVSATTNMASKVKAAIAPATVVGNSLGNGNGYFSSDAPTSQMMRGLHYGMSEVFLRGAYDSVNSFPSLDSWRNSVRMLEDASAKNYSILALVKIWVSASTAQQQQWLRYSLSTFLIGADSKQRFNFNPSASAIKTAYDPMLNTRIGTPTGAKVALSSGAYQRAYSNGMVVVNPGSSTVKVTLPRVLKTTSGQSVTSVTLGAHDGALLTNP